MRISKVYTRTGDDGTTGLVGNERVSKDDARIVAIGDVDELNSWIGVLRSDYCVMDETSWAFLSFMQNDLFNVGGELAMPPETLLTPDRVAAIEVEIDTLNKQLPPPRDFIMPYGDNGVAWIHVARTVARRAERSLIALNRVSHVNAPAIQYLNRVSDFLFVLARHVDRQYNQHEVEEYWRHGKE